MKRARFRAQWAFTPYNTQANDTEQWSSRIIASTAHSTRCEYAHTSALREVTFIQAKSRLCGVCEVGPCIGSGKSHVTDGLPPLMPPCCLLETLPYAQLVVAWLSYPCCPRKGEWRQRSPLGIWLTPPWWPPLHGSKSDYWVIWEVCSSICQKCRCINADAL